MACSTKNGTCLLSLFSIRSMAVETLFMKSRLEIQPCLRSVALLTTNSWFSRFEFPLVKNILSLLIPMVTLLAGEVSFHVTMMRKENGRAFPFRKGRTLQRYRVWLGPEDVSKGKEEGGHHEGDEKSLLFHSCSILSGSRNLPILTGRRNPSSCGRNVAPHWRCARYPACLRQAGALPVGLH